MSTFETLEGSRVKISMEIDSRSLEDAMQREYIKTAKDFNMPGFRKGKAPRRVIETTYGPFVFLTARLTPCIIQYMKTLLLSMALNL